LTADPSIALFRLPFQKKKKKTVYSFNQFTQQLKNRYSLFDMDANLQVEIKKKIKKISIRYSPQICLDLIYLAKKLF
jgi:hypothetical protein